MPRTTRPLRLEALQKLIETSGLTFNNKNSRSWVFDCPECGKSEKLYVRRRDGRVRCWHCGRDGKLEGPPEFALAALLNRSVRVIQDLLYGEAFVVEQRLAVDLDWTVAPNVAAEDEDYGQGEEYIAVRPEEVLPTGLAYPLEFLPAVDPRAKRGLDYLLGRGITPGLCTLYDLRYDPVHRRVIFPVVTRGVLVGWQARTIGAHEWVDAQGRIRKVPKILTTMVEGMRDNVLMFEHRLEGSRHAVLSEGPVDALKCDLCGGNVCTMGKIVSPGQIARLKASGVKRLVLAQDPDAAMETSELVKAYRQDFEMYYMTPEGTGFEDFGAMPPEAALECFRAAEPVHPQRIFLYLDPEKRFRF